jgi:ribosome biogenesis GTPase
MEGVVTKVTGNQYTVIDSNGEYYNCVAKGKLKIRGLKSTNPITVGDKVNFDLPEKYETGQIFEIQDRKNYIIRRSTNLSRQFHIIAANVDQAILVVTIIEPETNTDFIDRYLVSAEAFSIPVIIVFNKIDLYKNKVLDKFREFENIYNSIGYKTLAVSAIEGLNIDKFKDLFYGKISVINGNSGVGKSFLIKKIAPDQNIKVGEISSFHKTGMHTTSFSEMFFIGNKSYIIDTPGIKGFGLIDFYKEELYHYFPEIFKISSNCKFHNCTHIHEPDCAVIDAVKEGKIPLSRYTSYFNMFHDENEKYRL